MQHLKLGNIKNSGFLKLVVRWAEQDKRLYKKSFRSLFAQPSGSEHMFTIRDCHDDEIDTLDESVDKGIVL